MTKKHLIEVYQEAARMVAEGQLHYSCTAVKWASGASYHEIGNVPQVRLYAEIMQIDLWSADLPVSIENQTARVLALLIMAEWVRTDYKP